MENTPYRAKLNDIKKVAKHINPKCPELYEREATYKILHTNIEFSRLTLGIIDTSSYLDRTINNFLEVIDEYSKSIKNELMRIVKYAQKGE